MNKEELASLGFDESWLDESAHPDRGYRRDELEFLDYEIVKELYEHGGTEVIDHFLNACWTAYDAMGYLIDAVDGLFGMTKFGVETEAWGILTSKMVEKVIEDMDLALINAESTVQYEHDPLDRADRLLEGWAYGVAQDLKSLITSDSESTSKGEN